MPSVHNAAVKREKCHKRQNGLCAICGMSISLRETGDMMATLDHIVPKSRGGGGSLDNLRVAHRVCNKLRGNDVSDVITTVAGVRAFRWNAFGARSAILAAAFMLCASGAMAEGVRVVPDPIATPGALNPDVTQETIGSTICLPGWTKTIRPPASYTTRLKVQQLTDPASPYFVADADPSAFEEDHLVSLEDGGHPSDPRNLWPEAWNGTWGAHRKDRIETRLKIEICSGRLPLADAQRMLATDWIAAYRQFFGEPQQ